MCLHLCLCLYSPLSSLLLTLTSYLISYPLPDTP